MPFGDDPTNPVLRFTITQDVVVYAVFELHETQWNLSCVIVPSSAESVCSVSGTGRASQGSNPVLRASYTNPYRLDHWEIDGENKGGADELEVRNIQSDVTAYVYFEYVPQNRTITVASNNPSYGSVQIERVWDHATSDTSLVIAEVVEEAKLTATPNSGYQFEGWYYDNEKVSSDAVYTFTLPEWSTDRTYTANFIEAQA